MNDAKPSPTKPLADKPRQKTVDEVRADEVAANQGFDPYNSGAFNVRNTWDRVNRKK